MKPKICRATSAPTCLVAFRAFAITRTAQAILLLLSTVLQSRAGNSVTVDTYVPNLPDNTIITTGDTNTHATYETLTVSADGNVAQASAYAFYGLNQIGVSLSLSLSSDPNGDGYAKASSKWSDTLTINAQIPNAPALFRFNVPGVVPDGVGVDGWDIQSSAGLEYQPGDLPVNDSGPVDYPIHFTNSVSFSMDVSLKGAANFQRLGNANAELNLTGILLPDGAAITSGSGFNWLTNYTIIHPALGISQSGTNALLHWSAFDTNNFIVETTTNISDPAAWGALTNSDDPSPVQTGDTDFSLTYPLGEVARFFRLRFNF